MHFLKEIPDVILLFVLTLILLFVYVALLWKGHNDELIKTLLNGGFFALVAMATGRKGTVGRATDVRAETATINVEADQRP